MITPGDDLATREFANATEKAQISGLYPIALYGIEALRSVGRAIRAHGIP